MKKIILLLFAVLLLTLFFFRENINDIRLLKKYSDMFVPADIDHNFRTLHQQYPALKIPKVAEEYQIPIAKEQDVFPKSFTYENEIFSTEAEIEKRHVTSLIVIKDGQIIKEEYFRGNTKEHLNILFSCTKSIMSLLIGIAKESGAIQSLEDAAVKYAPELKGTVYEKVTIQNLLDMSSGVRWIEDYDDLNSEIVQVVLAGLKGSVNDFSKVMKRERAQGTYNHYVSMDTQILGMVISGATNQKLADYLQEALWSKLGVEQETYFITDNANFPLAYAGLMVATRDLAKVGLLMLNEGKNHKGEQIVSPEWIKQSIMPDHPRLMPGKNNPASEFKEGYKNQWWIPVDRDNEDYAAIGIFGQTLYINPGRNIVIAVNSAYPEYNEDFEHADSRRLKMLQAMAQYIDEQDVDEENELKPQIIKE